MLRRGINYKSEKMSLKQIVLVNRGVFVFLRNLTKIKYLILGMDLKHEYVII